MTTSGGHNWVQKLKWNENDQAMDLPKQSKDQVWVWGLFFQILSNKHVLINRLLPSQNLSMHNLVGVFHNELKHGQIVVSTRQIKIMKILCMDRI